MTRKELYNLQVSPFEAQIGVAVPVASHLIGCYNYLQLVEHAFLPQAVEHPTSDR